MALVLVALVALVVLGPGSAAAAGPDPDGDGLTTTFETAQSHTDPHLADTDGDGTPDGSEDPDRDGLVNVWEQRLGLAPRSVDTDGDGRSDAREDPDGDRLGNLFEIGSSLTDPRSADTDRDGVRDGAEDPDEDGLSDAGEYRYHTSPVRADTDGDGTSDWNEDSNSDGLPDGRTQDARPVPSGLMPSLAHPMDRPASYERCHVHNGHARPIVCRHGTTGPKVVLFGDSHALQWRSTLERIADSRGWRLFVITKSACPAAKIDMPDPDCASWRQQAIAAIKGLRPAMVITSEHDEYAVLGAASSADSDRLWQRGLTSTLRSLKGVSPRVVLLGDTPRWIDAAQCLPHHRDDIAACARRRSVATGRARFDDDRRAAAAANVSYASTFGLTCPYDPCPPVIDHLLVAYDNGHLTYAFARTLWRGLEPLLPRL